MLRPVGEGGSGCFFDRVAEKLCMARDDRAGPS